MTVNQFISVKLGSKSITELTLEIINLMSGSVELTGSGGTSNSEHRDYDIQASNEQELDNFLDTLTNRGYSYIG
tara:strand:+ start:365 stop:586 length:222 start_codon:yes stop_codon:yes gene_type:complete